MDMAALDVRGGQEAGEVVRALLKLGRKLLVAQKEAPGGQYEATIITQDPRVSATAVQEALFAAKLPFVWAHIPGTTVETLTWAPTRGALVVGVERLRKVGGPDVAVVMTGDQNGLPVAMPNMLDLRAHSPSVSPSPQEFCEQHGVPFREGDLVRGGRTIVLGVPEHELDRWVSDLLRVGKTWRETVFGDGGEHEARIMTAYPLERVMGGVHAEAIHEAGCIQEWVEVVGAACHGLVWSDDPAWLAQAADAVRFVDPDAEVVVAGLVARPDEQHHRSLRR